VSVTAPSLHICHKIISNGMSNQIELLYRVACPGIDYPRYPRPILLLLRLHSLAVSAGAVMSVHKRASSTGRYGASLSHPSQAARARRTATNDHTGIYPPGCTCTIPVLVVTCLQHLSGEMVMVRFRESLLNHWHVLYDRYYYYSTTFFFFLEYLVFFSQPDIEFQIQTDMLQGRLGPDDSLRSRSRTPQTIIRMMVK
jgi:hypothetical protein